MKAAIFCASFTVGFLLSIILGTMLSGCTPRWFDADQPQTDTGIGGQDVAVIDLPFEEHNGNKCTQGVGGSYSHQGTSTHFDVDFDTSNWSDEPLFAPVSGIAYVHTENPQSGFGNHINIEMMDGSYIVLGHLESVFVANGEEVAAGQLIAFEGTTGNSTGDHVHIGRHSGDAQKDALLGRSLEGLSFKLDGEETPMPAGDMVCDLTSGKFYVSALKTALWHPNGTLIKTPHASTVYLVEDDKAKPFSNQTVFWSQNYDFADVALVSQHELLCHGPGGTITEVREIQGAYDYGDYWLLIGARTDPNRLRYHVRASSWQAVLASWGIVAQSEDDLLTDAELGFIIEDYPMAPTLATFRDGALVKEEGSSAVYVIADGTAMPIETWQTYLLADFNGRDIITVADGELAAVQGRVGDCASNVKCLHLADIQTCGGPALTDDWPDEDPQDDDTDDPPVDTGEPPDDTDDPPVDTGDPPVDDTDDLPVDTGTLPDDTDDPPADTGDAPDDPPETQTLRLYWQMPMGITADRISLSGQYYFAGGFTYGWTTNVKQVYNTSSISYEFEGVNSGDSFRFSIEFADNDMVSWSCAGPFPPGYIQGTVSASVEGVPLSVYPVADPMSLGCGLLAVVP